MIGQPKISFVENEFRLTGQSKIFLSKFTLDTIIISLSLKFYNIAIINEKTNEITISKLPYVTLGKEKIPVLTSDIATIIIEQTKKIIDPKDIIIKSINSNHFFAIDNNTEKIIPQIDKKEIYILIKKDNIKNKRRSGVYKERSIKRKTKK